MKALLTALSRALAQGQDTMLLTLVAASGSSPRGAGAHMAVFQDGDTLGTIGGGAIELAAARQALEALGERRSLLKNFCLRPNEIEDIGMICGGDVTLCFQFMDHRDAALQALLAHALALLASGEKNAWLVICANPQPRLGLYTDSLGLEGLSPALAPILPPVLGSHSTYHQQGAAAYYGEPLIQRGRVYIFGGGHVGQALAALLAGVDFRVTVFDDRREVAAPSRFPLAEEVILGDYRHIARWVTLTPADYVVIMTPGHQADFTVLAQTLGSPARYVGCIGSRRKVAETKRRLMAQGLEAAQVERMHSPIGLSIGAETPAEIAVSIAAELIAVRQEALATAGEPPGAGVRR